MFRGSQSSGTALNGPPLPCPAKPSTTKKSEYNPWVSTLDPVPVEENGTFPLHVQLRDGDYHYVYACIKVGALLVAA